jgi:type II secretory pathway component PulJ
MMWGGLFTGIFAQSWVRSVAGIALVTLTIILFLFNLRRQGERAGRAAARLDQMERTNAIQQKMLDAASRRPRDRDDLVERLRDGQF